MYFLRILLFNIDVSLKIVFWHFYCFPLKTPFLILKCTALVACRFRKLCHFKAFSRKI